MATVELVSPRRGGDSIAVLQHPEDDVPKGEKNIRMDDYLNDKIQNRADFADLPDLITSVLKQRNLLEVQMRDAKVKLDETKNASTSHESDMKHQIQTFREQQDDIRTRLMVMAVGSQSVEEATTLLKGPMEKLRKVELARSYVALLKDVDSLAQEARDCLPRAPKEALIPYIKLRELSISLDNLHKETEEAAVHLVRHVKRASETLWKEMRKIMMSEFEAILKARNWPTDKVVPDREFQDCFQKLLDLQAPHLMSTKEPLALLPMEALAKEFVAQFRYFFFINQTTSQVHKLGNLFFEWFLGVVIERQDYLRENVTPILAAHFRGSKLAGSTLYIDSVSAFITALLPTMSDKVTQVAKEVSLQPVQLGQFIAQLTSFDEKLRTEFNYDGGNPDLGWKGLTWDVLAIHFGHWVNAELIFANRRYEEITSDTDLGQIDYDGAEYRKTKPTYGATKIADLTQSVTEQYRHLRKFSQKVRFFIDIQAYILNQYLHLLSDSLGNYQSAISAFSRTIQGISREERDALGGVQGLERLCRLYGSADCICENLKRWKSQEFFTELWNELQDRAEINYRPEDRIAGSLTLAEIRTKTSNDLGISRMGSLFDSQIDNYTRLGDKIEDQITETIQHGFSISFKLYFSRPQWRTIGDELVPDPTTMAITPELDSPLRSLKENMAFLFRALGEKPFRRIWRLAFANLQDRIYHELLIVQDFTSLGATRLMADLNAIESVIFHCVRDAGLASHLSMPKLRQGVKLLSTPVKIIDGQEGIPLAEVNSGIFGTKQQVEAMLKNLGYDDLNVNEARIILGRRVEANDLPVSEGAGPEES